MTLSAVMSEFPPCVVRFLARQGAGHGCKRVSNAHLASKSGLSAAQIVVLSKSNSWAGVDFEQALQFMSACGFDPFHTKRARHYLRRTLTTERPFAYSTRTLGRPAEVPDPELLLRAAGYNPTRNP